MSKKCFFFEKSKKVFSLSALPFFLKFKICSFLLCLDFVLSTVLRPHLKIYEDSSLSSDKGNTSLLLCLNFFSAFDTVDHSMLIQQLETSFGISGTCLKWISSYLSNKNSAVSINNSHSTSCFPFGVFEVSVLGLFLYSSYF